MNSEQGGWIPISQYFVKDLPKNRPYTRLEAAYCLQLDYNNDKGVTISGYAELWQWSRKKVRKFFDDMNITVKYPHNTKKRQNQKGQIRVQIRDRKGTDKGQIRLINNKDLQEKRDRKGTEKGQIRDRSGNTTIYTNTNTDTNINDITHKRLSKLNVSSPEKNEFSPEKVIKGNEKKGNNIYTSDFLIFWDHYPRKTGKGAASKIYNRIDKPPLEILIKAIETQKKSQQWQTLKYIPYPATWLNQRRWEDETTDTESTGTKTNNTESIRGAIFNAKL